MRGDRVNAASERWFRLLLRLYPPDFRDEMGVDLINRYRDRSRAARKAGAFAVAGVWWTALRDSGRNGLGERLRPAASWRRAGNWGRDMERVGRRLRQKPMFLAAVLATLTGGLGAFTVVYTAVDKVLIEPLPYREPDDLYMVWSSLGELNHLMVTGPHVAGLQKAGGWIEDASVLVFEDATLENGPDGVATRISLLAASANLFDLLGVRPALGSGFRPDDDAPDAPPMVVLSHGLWKRLGGDPGIIGTNLDFLDTPFTVLGVMPPDFQFAGHRSAVKPEAYIPFQANLAAMNPGNDGLLAVLRARRGAPPEEVHRAVEAVGHLVDEEGLKQGRALRAIGLHQELVEAERPALLALGFAGVFLVLVLTVNLASLLLARAAEREREFGVSRALGASGGAVVRAMLIEGVALGVLGGISGTLAGMWSVRLLLALGPAGLARREAIVVGWDVAFVVAGVGGFLGLAAAAVPAMWAARTSLAFLLSGIAVRGGAGSGRMRRGLLVVQVALSLVLLSTGGLVVRSFERLLAADPGFRADGVLTFQIGLFNRYLCLLPPSRTCRWSLPGAASMQSGTISASAPCSYTRFGEIRVSIWFWPWTLRAAVLHGNERPSGMRGSLRY